MTMSYKPSIGLIGCGDWGKNIARTLANMGVLGAIVDLTDRARALAEEFHVPNITLEALLGMPALQGVVIATPTPTHFPLAQQVLKSRKGVLIEKPMAADGNEIKALYQQAQASGLTLMAGHLLLYHGAFQQVCAVVHQGKLGQILHVESCRKNLGKIHAHEGVLWDLGPHDFSMIITLLQGMPQRIFSEAFTHIYAGKPDVQKVMMEYGTGCLAEIHLSRIHPEKEHKLTVIGTEGALVFDDTLGWDHKVTFFPRSFERGSSVLSKTESYPLPLSPSQPLQQELEHFIECLSQGTTPLSSALQAHHVLNLIQTAEQSAHQKQWITLKEDTLE